MDESVAAKRGQLTLIRVQSAKSRPIDGEEYQVTAHINGRHGLIRCHANAFSASTNEPAVKDADVSQTFLLSMSCVLYNPDWFKQQQQQPTAQEEQPIEPREEQKLSADATAREIAFLAAEAMNEYSSKVTKILSVEKQAAAGINYMLSVDLRGPQGLPMNCALRIFVHSRTAEKKLYSCRWAPEIDDLDHDGFIPVQDVNDAAVQEAAQFAANFLSD